MFDVTLFFILSVLVVVFARKVQKARLNRIQYYVYVPLYISIGAQYYSIFNFGMIHNGLEVDVIFFKSFFSDFLPNNAIQMFSLAVDAYLLLFCFPKHYDSTSTSKA